MGRGLRGASERSPSWTSRALWTWIALATATAAIARTAWRTRFGVDLADEPWHLAQAWRFVLGDRPFVDEAHPTQSAALLTWPLLEVRRIFGGGLEGLVLFGRTAWLALAVLVYAIAVRGIASSTGGRAIALLAALAIVVQAPFGATALSYNTWASLAFAAGIFLALPVLVDARRETWLLAAGIAHGVAVVAIQTYALPCVVFLAAAIAHAPRERRARRLGLYAAGALVVALAVLPFVLHRSPEADEALASRLGGPGGWLRKLARIAWQSWAILPNKLVVASALVVLALVARSSSRVAGWIVALVVAAGPIVLLPERRWIDSVVTTTLVGLWGVVAFALARRDVRARELLVYVWIPSLVAAATAAWTSGNGIPNAGFGFLPGVVATVVVAARVAKERTGSTLAASLAPLCLAGVFLRQQHEVFLGDDLDELRVEVERGAWRGVRATPRMKGFLDAFQRDLANVSQPGERLLVLEHFPAGYLLAPTRPATTSVWSIECLPYELRECVAETECAIERFDPDVVIEVERYVSSSEEELVGPKGPIDAYVERRFDRIVTTNDYSIWRKRWPDR